MRTKIGTIFWTTMYIGSSVLYAGAPGVGRRELKNRLIASDPDHFKEPVPREL